jgi:hypothetical protein
MDRVTAFVSFISTFLPAGSNAAGDAARDESAGTQAPQMGEQVLTPWWRDPYLTPEDNECRHNSAECGGGGTDD